jgi:hypothetical protein
MARFARISSPTVLAVVLAGCASQQVVPPPFHEGESSYRVLPEPGMTRYQLALGAVAGGAVPLDHPAPVYPPSQLAACPPSIRLRALMIVGTDGKVDDVRVDETAGVAPAFARAVRAAAAQWRFVPLSISRWAADANGNSHLVESVLKPFSLPYEFSFSCHDGKPRTSSSAS